MRNVHRLCLKPVILSLVLIAFVLTAGSVYAETRYVTDQLIITLREGQGNEYKIIKTLKTGTPLEIIEESKQHLKVRTESGLEGWVLRQYVSKKTPKPVIIADQKNRIDLLNTKLEEYKKDKESLQNELKTARSDHNSEIMDLTQKLTASRSGKEQSTRELNKISEKYNSLLKDSKEVINLVDERDSLRESNTSLQTQTMELLEENEELKQTQMMWWFVAGGGVFFVGWIVGKVSRQKRFY